MGPIESKGSAVKSVCKHPSQLWEGFWGIQLLNIGQSLGLFEELTEAKSAQELATNLGLEARYSELWCEASEAAGLLVHENGKYQAPEQVVDWMKSSGGFTSSHIHLSHRLNETLGAVFHGRALPEPPISLRLILQENLQQNYKWLFETLAQGPTELGSVLHKGERILEVGCGLGLGLAQAKLLYPNLEVYGLEADYDCAQEAENASKGVIHIGHLPAERFRQEFDIILCFRSLSSNPKPQELLDQCGKLLRKGGWFILGTEHSADEQGRKSAARFQGENFAYRMLAGDADLTLFSPEELEKMVSKAGLTIESRVESPDWATPLFLCRATR